MTWSNFIPRRTKGREVERRAETDTRDAALPQPSVESQIAVPLHGLRIAVLPDTQVRRGVPLEHLSAYGKYIAAKRPDVIVCIGDFWDFPSLSTYAKPGSIDAEGMRYTDDLAEGHRAMELFMDPIAAAAGYNPVKVFTRGNHEDRVLRAINNDPNRLMGVISEDDLRLEDYGWQAYPFLQPVVIGGVAFAHFFPAGVMGRALATAAGILRKYHQSAVAGHLQGRDIAYSRNAAGEQMTAIISGSMYQHSENYLSPMTNKHWRGAFFLHQVKHGSFDEMFLSLEYLVRKHGS